MKKIGLFICCWMMMTLLAACSTASLNSSSPTAASDSALPAEVSDTSPDQTDEMTAPTETTFRDAVNAAGYLDRTSFYEQFSDTDIDMISKMSSSKINGIYYESRPFNINELDGLEQYRFFNLSEPSEWSTDKYTWMTGDFISFFSFIEADYAKQFVDNFIKDIKEFSPNTAINLVSSGSNYEQYVSEELTTYSSVIMTHYFYRIDNTVLYLECISSSHAPSILDSLHD